MEYKTRFDLNAAVENWRRELAAEPNLTPEVRRELETHLSDLLAEFQRRGLNEEESFWLARRRVGHPQALGQEFLQANPTAVWRERVRWMAIAVLFVFLWSLTTNLLTRSVLSAIESRMGLQQRELSGSMPAQLASVLVRIVPLFALAFVLLRTDARSLGKLALVFQKRSRFVMGALGWLAIAESFNMRSGYNMRFSDITLGLASWPLALIGLIAWLMGPTPPGQSVRSESESAGPGLWPLVVVFILAEFVGAIALWMGGVIIFDIHYSAGLWPRMFFALQMPIIALAFVKTGAVTAEKFQRLRPLVLIWNLVLGALLTTPEIVSQLIMAAILQGFYELALLLARHWQRQSNGPVNVKL